MAKIKKTLTNHQTWKALNSKDHFQRFFKDYLKILQNKLPKHEVIGHNYSFSYHSCGQPHDKRNRDWRPFQHLEFYCQKNRYDLDAVRDMIELRINRKLLCECELLHDERSMRRKELELTFGLDFGGPVCKREFDIV